MAVFKVAFERCMSNPKRRKLAFHLRQSTEDFKALYVVSKGTTPTSLAGVTPVPRRARAV